MVKLPDEISKQIFNEEVRKKMSEKRKDYYAKMTPKERSERFMKIRDANRLRMMQEIKELKEECNYVIVIYHGGTPFFMLILQYIILF